MTFSSPELKEFPSDNLWHHFYISLFVTPGVMGEYEPKIEVQFPEVVPVAKSSTVKLECFALGKYVPLCVIIPPSYNIITPLLVYCINLSCMVMCEDPVM